MTTYPNWKAKSQVSQLMNVPKKIPVNKSWNQGIRFLNARIQFLHISISYFLSGPKLLHPLLIFIQIFFGHRFVALEAGFHEVLLCYRHVQLVLAHMSNEQWAMINEQSSEHDTGTICGQAEGVARWICALGRSQKFSVYALGVNWRPSEGFSKGKP